MADISSEIIAIEEATSGQELRQPIADALNAVNSGVLPVVSSSDAGKFMIVNQNGEWVAGNAGLVPTPTETKTITTNGTYDVTNYASADVEVPNSYVAGDEGKVVSNGELVAQTSRTVTSNNTYDTTLNNEIVVNVSGGGGGTLITKSITQNGTYNAQDDSADGYSSVTVNVSGGVVSFGAMSPPSALGSNDDTYIEFDGCVQIRGDGSDIKIDTGIECQSAYGFCLKMIPMKVDSSSSNKYYKYLGGSGDSGFTLGRYGTLDTAYMRVKGVEITKDIKTISTNISTNSLNVIELKNGVLKLNDVQKASNVSGPLQADSTHMYLGGLDTGYTQSCEYFEYAITDSNGDDLAHLYPAIDENGILCMYDTVEDQYLYANDTISIKITEIKNIYRKVNNTWVSIISSNE